MAFIDVNTKTSYIKPADLKKGHILSGVYKKTTKGEYRGKETRQHFLLIEGEEVGVNGSAQLNKAFEQVPQGAQVKLEYCGKELVPTGPNKGTMAHQWKVQYDPDSVAPVEESQETSEEPPF